LKNPKIAISRPRFDKNIEFLTVRHFCLLVPSNWKILTVQYRAYSYSLKWTSNTLVWQLWLIRLVVRASDLQLTVTSLNPCNMAIFRFFKMSAAIGGNGQECRTTSLCQILSNRGRDIAIFVFFSKWRLPLSWILNFLNFLRSNTPRRSSHFTVPNFD